MTLKHAQMIAGETGYLRTHLDLGVDTQGGPPLFHLLSGISVLAVALCAGEGAYSLYLDPIQPLSPNLYLLVLGPTGVGKTRAARLGQRVLKLALPTTILPSDFSREGLFETLASQPWGVINADEFKGLAKRAGREYNGGLVEFLTEAYDSPPVMKRRTKTGGEVSIESPRFTLTAASTPEWFADVVSDGDFEGGWLARFLIAGSEQLPPFQRPSVNNVNPIIESMSEHVQAVGNLNGCADFSAVDDMAWPAMEGNYGDLAKVEPELRGFQARINAHLIKLAMIFHVSEHATELNIGAADWGRAIMLMEHLRQSVSDTCVGMATDRTSKALERIRVIIGRNGGIDRRKALQLSKMKAPDFRVYLNTLVETDEIKWELIPNERGRDTVWLKAAGPE